MPVGSSPAGGWTHPLSGRTGLPAQHLFSTGRLDPSVPGGLQAFPCAGCPPARSWAFKPCLSPAFAPLTSFATYGGTAGTLSWLPAGKPERASQDANVGPVDLRRRTTQPSVTTGRRGGRQLGSMGELTTSQKNSVGFGASCRSPGGEVRAKEKLSVTLKQTSQSPSD